MQQYDCTEQPPPQPPPPSAGGSAAANAGAHPQPTAGSQDNSNGKLLLPQLDRLHLAFKRRQVSPSASSSSQDQQAQQPPKSVIPTQKRVTEQLTKHWTPFKALRQRYAGTRFEDQRQLQLPQKHKATVQDSTLRVEMNNLEELAGRQRQGTRALLEAPLMARRHQAHLRQRCLPSALADVCLHDARFGGPHPCRPPTPP